VNRDMNLSGSQYVEHDKGQLSVNDLHSIWFISQDECVL